MASDTKLTVSLVLNDASFTKQINQINKDLKNIQSEFKNSSAGIDNFGNSLTGVQTKLKTVSAKFETQGKKVELYKNEIAKTSKTLEELTKNYKTQSSTLDGVKAKYDEAVKTMGENSDEAKALAKEIKDLEKEKKNLENRILSTNSRLTSLSTNLNNAEAEFKELDNEVKKTYQELDNFDAIKASRNLQTLSDNLDKTSQKFSTIGKGLNDVSGALAKLSAPMVAFGTYSFKVSKDFEFAMSRVKAASGLPASDMELLTEKARELGATTSKSAADAADGLGYMALAGWNTKEMLEGLEPLLRLSEAGTLDLGLASSLTTDSMGALKLQVKDMSRYLDIVSLASVATNTDIKDLLESFINVGATLSNLNIPLHEAAAVLGILGNNGTKGYEAGTKLNSILTRLTAQSKVAAKAWDNIGVSIFDAEGKFRGLTTILKETQDKLKDLTEEERQYFLKQAVGTDSVSDFTNLLASTSGELQKLTSELNNSEGALMDVALTMQDNVQGQLWEVESAIEELGLKFGEILLPMILDFLKKVENFANWLGEMSPQMREFLINTTLMTAGLSAVTKILGSFFTSASSIINVASKLTGALGKTASAAATTGTAVGKAAFSFGGLATSLGGVVVAAAPYIAAGAAIAAAGYAIYKRLNEEVIPEVDLFADKIEYTAQTMDTSGTYMANSVQATVTKISEATKQGVQSYLDLDEAANEHLTSLYVNSTKITQETATQLTEAFTAMGDNIKSRIQQSSEDTTRILTDFFETSSVLTEQHEIDALAMNDRYYQQQQAKITEYEAQIVSILNNAAEEKRTLTESEVATITDLRQKMRDESIKAYSETEEEMNIILGRLASYDERMTAEIASKHIAAAEETRLKSVDAATKEYLERVQQIEFMRDESGVITKEQADELIAEAERQRDEAIEAANDLKKGVIEKIRDMNKDVLDDVDTTTGKLKTKLDKFKEWWNNLWFNKKTIEIETVETKTTNYTRGTGGWSNNNGYTPTRSYSGDLSQTPEGTPLIDTSGLSKFASKSITDSVEIPNTASYMNDTVNAISSIKNNSKNNDNTISVLNKTLEETQKQNNLLMSLVTLMRQGQQLHVYLGDKEIIDKTTKQVVKSVGRSTNNYRKGKGGLGYV